MPRPPRTVLTIALSLLTLSLGAPAAGAAWPELLTSAPAQSPASRDAAVVIGIERYTRVPPVNGAEKVARAWYTYLRQTRGVPFVKMLIDAQANEVAIPKAIEEARQRVKKGGTLWFVFVGHGAPSADGKDGVLVGVDATQDADILYRRSVARSVILAELERGPQAHSVAILDTCFSGRTSATKALAPGLQPMLPVADASLKRSKVMLMTAGRASEFAGPLPRGGDVPAFSYLVLGALRGWGDADQDGKVTAAEAHAYAETTLATLLSGRTQTPQIWGPTQTMVLASGRQLERGPNLDQMVMGGAPKSGKDGLATAFGSAGLGFKGGGTGGGGDGLGRIEVPEKGGYGSKEKPAELGRNSKKRQVGKLALGTAKTAGFCKKSDIAGAVRRRASALRACYESRLQLAPKLAGQVIVRWKITTSGTTADASIASSSLKSSEVEACLLRTLRRIKYAKPEGGICVVQWPFVFKPG